MKKEKATVSKLEMLDALMENIPDSIYFKDFKSRFIGISKALVERLKINNSDEAFGKTDYDFFTKEHAAKAFHAEQNIINTGVPLIKIEEKETFEDREDRWVSTTKMPLYSKKGKIIGTFGISRDITESKQAEKEIKSLAKFPEENPNLVGRIDFHGKILYCNHVYKRMFKDNDRIPIKIQDAVKKIAAEKIFIKEDVEIEIGDRIFLFNLIPIKKENYINFYGIDITERKKAETEIIYLSYHDQLTGLYNRRFFDEETKRLDTKRQLPASIIMADVDRLKHVNDIYGHEKGDRLLIAASEIIKNSCRKEDIIARWGGDEFIIFLPKTSEKDALEIIDRIRYASNIQKLDDKINISISLGLTTKNDQNENMEHIIKQADKNMYIDKAR